MTNNKEEIKNLWKKFNKRRHEPNIFKILGMMDGAENRNSNFLAWLLNPNENHNLHTQFLKNFLELALKLSLRDEDLQNTQVVREKPGENSRPDIILENKDFLCVIEVKFGANETDEQCKKYFQEYGNKCKYILLDLDDKNYENLSNKYSSDKKFNFSETYKLATWKENVLNILNRIKSNNNVINNYISFLEEKFYIYEGISINPNDEDNGLNEKIKTLRDKIQTRLEYRAIYQHNKCTEPFSLEIHTKDEGSQTYCLLEFHEDKLLLKFMNNLKNFNENEIKKYTNICENNKSYFKYIDKNLITEKVIASDDTYINYLFSETEPIELIDAIKSEIGKFKN